MMEKLKNKIKETEELAGYVHYVYDIDKWESILKPLPKIKPILELKNENETYKLDKIAYYLNGKPVFLVVRGIPFSLEIEETNTVLRIKGYSADEINAKINSIYVNSVFRKGSLQFKDYLVLLLSNIITGLVVYIITFMSMLANQNSAASAITNATVGG